MITFLSNEDIDSTLEVEGKIADAKVVGNKISQISEEIAKSAATVNQTENGAVISITDKNGTTTATITNGKDGEPGKDGTSVTVASVSESTADGGSNVVTFSDGKTVTIKNGRDGIDATPVTPLFANDIEECTDTTKPYVLPDGLIYAYMPASLELVTNFTNLLPLLTDTDGSLCNGGKGYKTDTRLSATSLGGEKVQSGIECTGFIPCKLGDVIYLENIVCKNIVGDPDESYTYFCVYDKDKNFLGGNVAGYFESSNNAVVVEDMDENNRGNIVQINTANLVYPYSSFDVDLRYEDMAYFRISCTEITDESIITVNEPIVYEEAISGFEWKSTGLAFIPANYDKMVVVQQTPNFANSLEELEESGDPAKLYVLPDGFIYAYMAAGGAAYTNQIVNAVDENGDPYNGGKGWKDGWRLNSSGVEVEADGNMVTGYIPYVTGEVIRISGYTTSDAPNGYLSTKTSDFANRNSIQMQTHQNDGMTYGPDPTAQGVYMITLDPAASDDSIFKYELNDGLTAYIRVSMTSYNASELKVTIGEEIAEVIGFAWQSTGHAFVPANYEGRIVSLEEETDSIKSGIEEVNDEISEMRGVQESQALQLSKLESGVVVDYVKTEADEVIDKVIAAQNSRTFTFATITDLHYGNNSNKVGVENACKAMKYIDKRIKLDAVVILGDYTDGYPATGLDNAIGDFKAVNSVLDELRFSPNLRLQGNHDYYENNFPITHRFIQAFSDGVVWGNKLGGYFYRDFEDYKVRAICLNTVEMGNDNINCSADQYNWFIDSLDLSSREDAEEWQIVVFSHHPVDWWYTDGSYAFSHILNAYRIGGIWSGGGVSCDFSGKNVARLIGNIHGHVHNLLTDKIYTGNTASSNVGQYNIYRFCTPEACVGRENQYSGVWAEETTYNKTEGTAEETSFCVYCIDLDTHTVKAICYGAGYDRETEYVEELYLTNGVINDGYELTEESSDPVVSDTTGSWTYTKVPVEANTLYMTKGAERVWFFDKSLNPISTIAVNEQDTPGKFVTPDLTIYLSVSYKENVIDRGAETIIRMGAVNAITDIQVSTTGATLLDNTNLNAGSYKTVSNEAFFTYKEIPVEAGATYYTRGGTRSWYLDSNKEALTTSGKTVNILSGTAKAYTFTVPDGASYISIAYSKNAGATPDITCIRKIS